MSFFIKDAFAIVWSVDKVEEKYVKARIGTSEKDQQGQYVNSSWFATFVGKAVAKADSLEPKDRITIHSGKIQNVSVKQSEATGQTKATYKNYLNVVIFDFTKQGENKVDEESDEDSAPIVEESDEMPF